MSAHLRQHDGLTQHIRPSPSERAPVIWHVKTYGVSSATLTAETLACHTDMVCTTCAQLTLGHMNTWNSLPAPTRSTPHAVAAVHYYSRTLHVSRMSKQFVLPDASTQRHMPCAVAHYRTVH
jgi:hypothetical protein